jgi:hypothetical protein
LAAFRDISRICSRVFRWTTCAPVMRMRALRGTKSRWLLDPFELFRVFDQNDFQSRRAKHCVKRHRAHVPLRFLGQQLRRICLSPTGERVQSRVADL